MIALKSSDWQRRITLCFYKNRSFTLNKTHRLTLEHFLRSLREMHQLYKPQEDIQAAIVKVQFSHISLRMRALLTLIVFVSMK